MKPDLIRVDADEVTYPMHIILRFEMEQSLFADEKSGNLMNKVNVNDIPKVWNKVMKDSLNVDVPSDAKGALQDIHWAIGMYYITFLKL